MQLSCFFSLYLTWNAYSPYLLCFEELQIFSFPSEEVASASRFTSLSTSFLTLNFLFRSCDADALSNIYSCILETSCPRFMKNLESLSVQGQACRQQLSPWAFLFTLFDLSLSSWVRSWVEESWHSDWQASQDNF